MKLSLKNKIFILVFIVIILGIVGILVHSARMVGNKSKYVYDITNSSILFYEDTNMIDTTDGGKIEEKWNGEYYYLSNNAESYTLGMHPVIYENNNDSVNILGTTYQVKNNGEITKINDLITIRDTSPYFYKLDDRLYLIVSNEIYTSDRTIYTKKYLLISLDKKGNASLLNDSINVRTINPVKLEFANYLFDIANEKLIIGDLEIDLKTVIGSSNEYVEKEEPETQYNYDEKELLDAYNELVNDFTKYAKNHDLITSANNQVTYNNVVINGNTSNDAASAENTTPLSKRVSLRGAIAYQSYIDVTYAVTDPENKYQAVYLLVTGEFNGVKTTEKIILDKYETKYRIYDLTPNSEYTISLGDIEIVTDDLEEKSLYDKIEDVINIRTSKIKYELKIEKISSGKVYFNYKMPTSYAFESCDIILYVNGIQNKMLSVNYSEMISNNGFSGSFELDNGTLYELRVENAVYSDKKQDVNISKKFALAI